MKTLLILIVMGFYLPGAMGQCLPDVNCTDPEGDGQICPAMLSGGTLGMYYEQSITMSVPDTFQIGASAFPISKATLDLVDKLPPGLTFTAPDRSFVPDSLYCGVIAGIPTTIGTYPLKIVVSIFMKINGTDVLLATRTDTTSKVITIDQPGGLPEQPIPGFLFNINRESHQIIALMHCTPGYYEDITFAVTDVYGHAMRTELIARSQFPKQIVLATSTWAPGIYFIRLLTANKSFTKKIVVQ